MRLFNGKPLLFYTLQQALRSSMIDDVYVSTESPEIVEFSENCGAKVPFVRPVEMCGDDVHGSVPIIHMLEQIGGATDCSYCLQLLPTSPLKKASTIDAVVELAKTRRTNVISVTPTGKILFHLRTLADDGTLRSLMKDIVYNFQTQDMPELNYLNGAIYCAPADKLLQHRTFQYGNPVGFVMNPIEAIDIDTETDFVVAERLAGLVEQISADV